MDGLDGWLDAWMDGLMDGFVCLFIQSFICLSVLLSTYMIYVYCSFVHTSKYIRYVLIATESEKTASQPYINHMLQ